MKAKKIEYIYLELYGLNIWYMYGWSRAELLDYVSRKYGITGTSTEKDVEGSVIPMDVTSRHDGAVHRVYVLWLESPEHCPNMAHEIFHIVRHRFDTLGIPLSVESDEAYAYLITWVMNQVMEVNGKRAKEIKLKKK